jgi:hypothetical protein
MQNKDIHIVKTNRKEKFWFHQIRAANYFFYRYWWLAILFFLLYLVLWYWFCYRVSSFECSEGTQFRGNLKQISSQLDSCCSCSSARAPECPDRVLVFQICNSNNARDDDFDIYLNNKKIGSVYLNTDDQVGSAFIASTDNRILIRDPDFTCPLSKMKIFYFDPSIVRYGINTIQMRNIQNNNNSNRGSIDIRNYLMRDFGLRSPCKVADLSYGGSSGESFITTFNYTRCCE